MEKQLDLNYSNEILENAVTWFSSLKLSHGIALLKKYKNLLYSSDKIDFLNTGKIADLLNSDITAKIYIHECVLNKLNFAVYFSKDKVSLVAFKNINELNNLENAKLFDDFYTASLYVESELYNMRKNLLLATQHFKTHPELLLQSQKIEYKLQ